ncbi:hypothetical protein VCRA2112O187_260015 [Vibrio crassostreae]|nr:hypothetical protein VCRA2112O187_260015 [Vibrio crassostreae]CAK2832106.1 hypothetical protein VCRA219O171_20018 [Vibrio crassostreae]CAK2835476.1 hypothetical protein VCRA2121O264_20018 [Vibrio crassostreae]
MGISTYVEESRSDSYGEYSKDHNNDNKLNKCKTVLFHLAPLLKVASMYYK